MTKPHFRLRLIAPSAPTAAKTMEEKRAAAIAYLKQRGIYVLDADAPKPRWGIPGVAKAGK